MMNNKNFIIRPNSDLIKNNKFLENFLSDFYSIELQEEDYILIGQQLWNLLGISDEFEVAKKEAKGTILEIILESSDPKILKLPWELLHDGQSFLGKNNDYTFNRRIPKINVSKSVLKKEPLRVLFFSTLPDDLDLTSRLAVEEEQLSVLFALSEKIKEGKIKLKSPNDGRFETFQKLLNEFTPHLLFLSGHGDYNEKNKKGYFLFEDKFGKSQYIDEEELSQAFIGSSISCVVLSSCKSAKASTLDLNNGLLRRLSLMGIPYAIGMRESVYDEAGAKFAESFCRAVSENKSISLASQIARETISTIDNIVANHWWFPIIYSHDTEGFLTNFDFQVKVSESESLEKADKNGIIKYGQLTYPELFIGRRNAFRKYNNFSNFEDFQELLIVGEGGTGKTSLVSKLALEIKDENEKAKIFTFSYKTEEAPLFTLLEEINNSISNLNEILSQNIATKKKLLIIIKILVQKHKKLIFVFDNLETVQSKKTKEIECIELLDWLEVVRSCEDTILLITSRWEIPNLNIKNLIRLSSPSFVDFTFYIHSLRIKPLYFNERDKLRIIYEKLNGNFRGVQYFSSAIEEMNEIEESNFFNLLRIAQDKLAINITIENILEHRSDEEKELLKRLSVYKSFIPIEGIEKIALDMENSQGLLYSVLSFSLVEEVYNSDYSVLEYLISPLVLYYLESNNNMKVNQEIKLLATDYLGYLYQNERKTIAYAYILRDSLLNAGMLDEANIFTVKEILGYLNKWGYYKEAIKILKKIVKSDVLEVKIRALNSLGKQYTCLSNLEKANEYYNNALTLSKESEDKHLLIDPLNGLGYIYFIFGEYEKSLIYFEEALDNCIKSKNINCQGVSLNGISQVYDIVGKYDKAIEYLNRTIIISKKVNDNTMLSGALNNIALIFRKQGENGKALKYYNESLTISQEIGDKRIEGNTLNNIAQIYRTYDKNEKALEYLYESLSRYQEIEDNDGEARTLNNMATMFHELGMKDKALKTLILASSITHKTGHKKLLGVILHSLACIYFENKELENALIKAKESLSIKIELDDKVGINKVLNTISEIFAEQENPQNSLTYFNELLEKFREKKDIFSISMVLLNIGYIHLSNKNMQKAVNYLFETYTIALNFNFNEILDDLDSLSQEIGLSEGLESWELFREEIDNRIIANYNNSFNADKVNIKLSKELILERYTSFK